MTPASALLITCGILLVVLFVWGWRESQFSAELQSSRREGKYLLREIDDQRRMRKDETLMVADAMELRKKAKVEDTVACEVEWRRMWEGVFDTLPCRMPEAQDENGNFIWENAAGYAIDLKRFRGLNHGQVRRIVSFVLAVKKAMQDEQRMLETLCPTGEIEFDAEGGLRVK